MSNYLDLSLIEINNLLKEGKIKPIDLVNEAFERIEANEGLNAFITLNKEDAINKALELEELPVELVEPTVGFDSPSIFITLLLTLFKSTPRFSRTLAATPSPSRIKPKSKCSVPI